MEPKERIEKLLEYTGLNPAAFAQHIGAKTKQCIYEILKGRTRSISADLRSKIISCYPEINDYWLMTGKGGMKNNNNSGFIANNNSGNIHHIGWNTTGMVHDEPKQLHPMVQETSEEFQRAPIVPASVAKEPGLDSFEYVQDNIGEVELSNVVVKDMTIYMWHKINDLSMSPRYIEGDLVGLQLCTEGCTIIPGNVYGIDTKSNGMIVRKLYPVVEGYIAKALNSEEYPEFFIKQDDIIRIYRKMIQVRL